MKSQEHNFLFIGYKYLYGNSNFGKNLDIYIFIEALSRVINKKVSKYYLDCNSSDTDSIMNYCSSVQPKYIFFNLANDEISIECLNKLKKKYVTINWFGDDQWRFDSFSSEISQYFTYSITTDKYSLIKYKELGRNVILSQWAAIDFNDSPVNLSNSDFEFEVSFVGGYSYTREWLIEYLKKNDIDVKVFGKGWDQQNTFLEYQEVYKTFRESKISLNLSNSVPKDFDFVLYFFKKYIKNIFSFKNLIKFLKSFKFFLFYKKSTEQIKARNFEIPIAGGFQISNYALSLEDYLEIGKEVVVFNTKEELLTLINFYLKNEFERNMIRNNAYENSKKNIYEKRLVDIIDQIRH